MKDLEDENGNNPEEKSYHHGNLRATLIETGLALLENSENNKLSLREIARQSGVSANAVYRHFANKEALLLALATEGFDRLKQAMDTFSSENSSEVILNAGRAYIRFACQNPALFRLMFGPFVKARHKEQQCSEANSCMDLLYSAIASAKKLGIEDTQTTTAVLHAWGLVHGISHLLLDEQMGKLMEDNNLEDLIDATLRQATFAMTLPTSITD